MCSLVFQQKVRGMALDDVVVLNVDTNTLETPFEDLQTLPSDVVRTLFDAWEITVHLSLRVCVTACMTACVTACI